MKVLAINSSPRKEGQSRTKLMLDHLVIGIRDAGGEVEVVDLPNKKVNNCVGCFSCFNIKNDICIYKDDMVTELVPKWLESDLVIYGTPVYGFSINATLKTFVERLLPLYVYVSENESNFESADTLLLRGGHRHPSIAVLAVAGIPDAFAFDEVSHYVNHVWGKVLVAEIYRHGSTLMTLPFFKDKVSDILDATIQAGRELVRFKKISSETMARIKQPLHDDPKFVKNVADSHLTLLPSIPITADNTENQSKHSSINLSELIQRKPEKVMQYFDILVNSLSKEMIRPTSYKSFPSLKIDQAYEYMDNSKNIEKVVVTFPDATTSDQNKIKAGGPSVNTSKSLGPDDNFHGPVRTSSEAIAIIGMSGRFARSKTLDDLWEHLSQGTDLIEEVSRWDLSKYFSGFSGGKTNYCKHGSFLEGIDQFDPLFFKISGLEAAYMDPQQRFFLEESWKALEDAGYAGEGVVGRQCGVYVGCGAGDYQQLFNDNAPAQAFWGNASSVIPARIAYYLDLQGPAIAIDTACSSSLVAIHLACQGLWAGETELALAGGVFIQSTPWFYKVANRAGMLSPTGRCHTFDSNADGFVPGEGVGVIVLKRLQEALDSGDRIYGVIRGSGINQDGTTNGITAPSANSQERLERHVYDTFHIHPEQIQMVEAHGTGTILGDPIEYDALTRAFRKYTDKKEYCAIGSIKTNLGHPAAAAGVAGVMKVLLSLKHRQIPPSLHYQLGNSNIQFKDGPFYVNTRLKEWNISSHSKRCAVISSFGFSGTNAHMVIEEAPNVERRHSRKPGYLIVLSACTSEQLRQQVAQMLAYCEQGTQVDCGNMSYTLLLGRKHFNHRLACVVRSRDELMKLFKKWLEKGKVLQIYISKLHENEHRTHLSLKRYGNECIRKCQNTDRASDYLEHLSTIADLYIQGYTLDFEKLFTNEQYSRISLPTYPFARERYWVPEIENQKSEIRSQKSEFIHPLLHKNTSDFSVQRFSSTFTGYEFFLADHVVKGRRVLPAVAYIEMARVAGQLAANSDIIKIRNVVWSSPVRVNSVAREVSISLYPEGNHIAFEVSSSEEGCECMVHSQGGLDVGDYGLQTRPKSLDIDGVLSRCSKRLQGVDCYKAFANLGLDYGSSFQGIEDLSYNAGEALARLKLPDSVTGEADQFVLHPSLLDGALQSVAGLIAGNAGSRSQVILLPFALSEVMIYGQIPGSAYAYVRYSSGADPQGKVFKYDIDITDSQGQIVVVLKEFVVRALEKKETSGKPSATQAGQGLLYTTTVWQEQPMQSIPALESSLVDRLIIVDIHDGGLLEALASVYPETEIISFAPLGKVIDDAVEAKFIEVFDKIKSCLEAKTKRVQQILILVPDTEERYCYAPLAGLIKTAYLENPRIRGKVIYYPEKITDHEQQLLTILKQELHPSADQDIEVLYSAGIKKRQVKRLIEVKLPSQDTDTGQLIKPGGVYWLTGGLGGLGRIFVQHLGDTNGVKLIVSGRSKLDGEKQKYLSELQQEGVDVTYIQADISKGSQIKAALKTIKEKYGKLNGIIHSAGIIRDAFMQKKTNDQIKAVFAPKVKGAIKLDRVTMDEEIDFMVFFSSVAGVLGNIGQSDYAGANAFLNEFAVYRQGLVNEGKRCGKTLSIGWPLWRDGGMKVDKAIEEIMEKTVGMVPLQTVAGVSAFDNALKSGNGHVMVMEGDLERIRSRLHLQESFQPMKVQKVLSIPPQANTNGLLERVKEGLVRGVSDLLKVKREDIGLDVEMSDYGFDSIMLTEFANKMNQEYEVEVNPAVFFEHPTLGSFAEYLVENHGDFLAAKYKVGAESVAEWNITTETVHGGVGLKSRRSRFIGDSFNVMGAVEKEAGPIAVIGMSGRMPKSRDLDVFWKNLEEGKDLISEIPEDRWDWRDYYGDPQNGVNKTNIKWGGFIDDVDKFDPLFFDISPKEAELMDPQQRLFLETVWQVIEDAGYKPSDLSGTKTGLYVGVATSDYETIIHHNGSNEIDAYTSTGLAHSVLANRISYILNIHGPSEPIDTACSSSLVAIHRAVQSIQAGDCEMALAGGVNALLSPVLFISFSKAGMLAPDGRCKSFSKGADGYVRGEGVGAVLLKPLSRAVSDGDHIYGVIRGTAENHGGHANSLTAPNPNAQADLIMKAYERAGVSPDTVTYIEAHGTGTELGDPVEVNGLKKAFSELYRRFDCVQERSNYCGIGSVKSNIGHLEAAAGIAGVLKVLLSMKHKKIPATINYKELNVYIDLKDSPFYIVDKTMGWQQLRDENDNVISRRAGVSSFGFGGSNAHVIVEEYVSEEPHNSGLIEKNSARPILLVLSARNRERLKNYGERLLQFIKDQEHKEAEGFNLSDIAYTLQVGREAMDSRVAFLVKEEKGLINKLESFVAGKDDIEDCYTGEVKRNKETLTVFTADEDTRELIAKWIAKGKLGKLAELWVKGLVLDWDLLYGQQRPKRVSLPTYPFARERYWLPETDTKMIVEGNGGVPRLHPLLGRNTSDLTEQQFTTRLTGREFFLTDHRILNEKVLPGVVYIEMARAAGQLATNSDILRIRDIVWASPIRVNSVDREVSISLYPEGNHIAFEVNTAGEGGNRVVHSQGRLEVGDYSLQARPKLLDIEGVLSRCSKQLQGEDCYKEFASQGLDYGPSFRGIKGLSYNTSETLARLQLPDSVTGEAEQFVLHPSLLDAAVQSIAGLMAGNVESRSQVILLPFSLREVMIYGPIPESAYAYVRYSPGVDRQGNVLKYDIDIADSQGQVVVVLKEFVVRAILDVSREEDFISNDIDLMLHQLVNRLKNGKLSVDRTYKIIKNFEL
ncbi:beta-ketoacyl synthase [Candidatus Scalindua japonica]|uniref:Beta-ketoacyl synthase n=1 Tax=Candidatus Scalindua japonica TaxID=1284222 RepID=A0A286TWI0_9BACT|nr:SDR family NAD(P)-dependent oxidoreductase [Candidatus Scalindua japonica]GAX60249.1 beta-ketoacyl synthase [Candidatus Scalindua japonica]